MNKKLTVKEILNFKGNRKLAEVYTHNALEAEACEKAGIEMIVSSENNNQRPCRTEKIQRGANDLVAALLLY